MKSHRAVVVAVGLLLAGAIFISTGKSAEEKVPPRRVNVADIGTEVELIGRLGQQLGKMMDVEGKWAFPDEDAKDYSLRFTVTHVNSQQLAEPLEFNISQVRAVTTARKNAIPKHDEQEMLEGVTWRLRAYETGCIHATGTYWKELGWVPASPYWYETFTSELVGIVKEKNEQK